MMCVAKKKKKKKNTNKNRTRPHSEIYSPVNSRFTRAYVPFSRDGHTTIYAYIHILFLYGSSAISRTFALFPRAVQSDVERTFFRGCTFFCTWVEHGVERVFVGRRLVTLRVLASPFLPGAYRCRPIRCSSGVAPWPSDARSVPNDVRYHTLIVCSGNSPTPSVRVVVGTGE